MTALEAVHLIRPWVLLALPVIAVLWWRIRPKSTRPEGLASLVAPHLADALATGETRRRRIYPIDGVAVALALITLAVSGPTWSRLPDPFQAETAPLVVVLKLTPSMTETDITPSRLDRARFKILDLVDRRAGAQTALIAYAGSAHRVVPLTTDPAILNSFLSGLSPAVMPVEGDDPAAAIARATEEMSRATTPGAILLVLDDISPGAVAEIARLDVPAITVLVAAPESVALPQLAELPATTRIRMSTTDSDLDQIERALVSAYRAAQAEDETAIWEDRGWWLAWPAAGLVLIWFRRGWTMRWAAIALLLSGLSAPDVARADGIRDWFWTPDQQGQRAFEARNFAQAADLFEDPMWRALSLFRDGQYEASAEAYAALDSAEAAFGEGMARLRNREYRAGLRGFERALELQPDYPEAQQNLEIAQAIVALVENTQSQSDTGEQRGIGADDIVMDNESGLGEQTTIERAETEAGLQSAEQWMRSVDTDVSDFLAARFRIETAGAEP